MNDADARFVATAIRRKRLFMTLMWVGVSAGLLLLGWTISRGLAGEPWVGSFVIATFVLLNARSNLRQAKFARVLEGLMAAEE